MILLAKKPKVPAFEFSPFSRKQLKLLTWWQEDSPVSDRFMVVADGSRSRHNRTRW